MVQFECLSTCVQCSYCTCLILCGDAPNCMWTDVAMPTLAGVNCAKHGEESIYSNTVTPPCTAPRNTAVTAITR